MNARFMSDTNMMVLMHFDWNGTEDSLKKFDESGKKIAAKIDGAEFIARLSPQNKKYHWTSFYKYKDYATFQKFNDAWFAENTRPPN